MLGHITSVLPTSSGKYLEPFIGGGALFFELSRGKRFNRAILGDTNPDLMNTYRVIRESVDELVDELTFDFGKKYQHSRENYLNVRSWKTEYLTSVELAARFIFLNRTCFNGLYRVNKKGGFNVPFGQYKDPVICDAINLRAVSKSLSKAKLVEKSFEWVLKEAKKGDIVYFDPPYYPISDTSKFVGYTPNGFGLEEHTRLAMVFHQLAAKGITTILSNSCCPTTLALYRDYKIIELKGNRCIGGPASYRKPVREIMVVANVEPEIQIVEDNLSA